MARTIINTSALARDAFVDAAASGVYQAADTANGMYIADVEKKDGTLVLHFKNTNAATRVITIRKGVGADVGPGWRALLGDLAVTIAATTGEQILWLTDTSRFKQSNGTINIDFSADTDVTVAAYRMAGV